MQLKSPSFTLNIVTPEKFLYTDQVQMAVIPGENGDLGILASHEALITILRPGTVDIYENNIAKDHIFINGGFAEVSDDVCTVLAEEALPVNELDAHELEQLIQTTSEKMNLVQSEDERNSLENDFKIANVKLEIFRKLKKLTI